MIEPLKTEIIIEPANQPTDQPTNQPLHPAGLAFAIVSPLVPVAALVYFATAYLVRKYNGVYVLRARYESGGMVGDLGCGLVLIVYVYL